jgi:hypothetical protein
VIGDDFGDGQGIQGAEAEQFQHEVGRAEGIDAGAVERFDDGGAVGELQFEGADVAAQVGAGQAALVGRRAMDRLRHHLAQGLD